VRIFSLFIIFLVSCQCLFSQQFRTRTAHINIKSQNSIKNIEADNFQVRSEYNASTGDISFVGLLKSFEFKMGALDRAYNSDRLNFGQHPKFTFEGKVENIADIDINRPGTYQASIKGLLRLWDEKRMTRAGSLQLDVLSLGVSRDIRIKVKMTYKKVAL